MVKKFSLEFKQQSVDYALTNTHLSISEQSNHLGVGKSSFDKWVRQLAPNKISYRELTPEQQRIIALKKENKELKMANEILKKAHVYFINNQGYAVKLHVNSSIKPIQIAVIMWC